LWAMAEVLRRILARHVRGRAISSVVDTASCPYARNFNSEAWRSCLSEAQPNRWRGSPLHAVIGYSNVANNLIPASQVVSVRVIRWGVRIDLNGPRSWNCAADCKLISSTCSTAQPPFITGSMQQLDSSQGNVPLIEPWVASCTL
jgi:hypothetical protein